MPQRGRNGGNAGQGSKWCSPEKRQRIYARDGWRCIWCGAQCHSAQALCGPELHATLDHVIPRSAGGDNAPSNLITACMRCNRARGSMGFFAFACWLWSVTGERAAKILERVIDAVCRPLPELH